MGCSDANRNDRHDAAAVCGKISIFVPHSTPLFDVERETITFVNIVLLEIKGAVCVCRGMTVFTSGRNCATPRIGRIASIGCVLTERLGRAAVK